MFKNTLKLLFLGLLGFSFLVYITIPKNITNNKVRKLPKYIEVVGKSNLLTKNILKNKEYIIVLNHDSLMIFNNLYKYTNKKIILVANISKTPWLIKKLAINNKLEEIYKNSTIPLINDSNGLIIKFLKENDLTQNAYFIYKIESYNKIKKISKGFVKKDTLQKGISEQELDSTLKNIAKLL